MAPGSPSVTSKARPVRWASYAPSPSLRRDRRPAPMVTAPSHRSGSTRAAATLATAGHLGSLIRRADRQPRGRPRRSCGPGQVLGLAVLAVEIQGLSVTPVQGHKLVVDFDITWQPYPLADRPPWRDGGRFGPLILSPPRAGSDHPRRDRGGSAPGTWTPHRGHGGVGAGGRSA
jgi:hypothetical protein